MAEIVAFALCTFAADPARKNALYQLVEWTSHLGRNSVLSWVIALCLHKPSQELAILRSQKWQRATTRSRSLAEEEICRNEQEEQH